MKKVWIPIYGVFVKEVDEIPLSLMLFVLAFYQGVMCFSLISLIFEIIF